MSGPENTFIASVHKHMPPIDDLYHMKNHNQYNSGIADCWYSGKQDLWIEWKFIVVPKRDDTMIDLHAGKKPAMASLQKEWLRARYTEGRNVWVGIGSKNGGILFDQPLDWERPFTTAAFCHEIMTRAELATEITNFLQGHG